MNSCAPVGTQRFALLIVTEAVEGSSSPDSPGSSRMLSPASLQLTGGRLMGAPVRLLTNETDDEVVDDDDATC